MCALGHRIVPWFAAACGLGVLILLLLERLP